MNIIDLEFEALEFGIWNFTFVNQLFIQPEVLALLHIPLFISLQPENDAMLLSEIKFLVLKDIKLEFKQRYAINGILLYVVSTIFVSYLSFARIIDPATWNSLFWIIMLFAAVNAVSKSFVQESTSRQLYYYTVTSPQAIILSKMIYNFMLMGVLSLLCLVVFTALMGEFVVNYPLFISALLLGSFGFASSLTMISAIASRTNNNFALDGHIEFPGCYAFAPHIDESFSSCFKCRNCVGQYEIPGSVIYAQCHCNSHVVRIISLPVARLKLKPCNGWNNFNMYESDQIRY